jgi:hypothetical protein
MLESMMTEVRIVVSLGGSIKNTEESMRKAFRVLAIFYLYLEGGYAIC